MMLTSCLRSASAKKSEGIAQSNNRQALHARRGVGNGGLRRVF